MRTQIACLSALLIVSSSLSLTACRNRENLAERVLTDPGRELESDRCGGSGQIVRPLIIEWSATDRASLEGRLRRGQVIVVRYSQCEVEVMRDCAVPQTGYDYIGITRKNDRIAIRTSDELYANMPLTAVSLEAKLAVAGELNVSMALVGNYEAQRSRFDLSELEGRCGGATHVIGAAQVGAFEFYTGAAAEIGAGVEVESVAGVGGRSTASREILNADGNAVACEASSPSDAGPPGECGALLRLELTALDGVVSTCQPGNVWNGSACVAQADSGGRKGNGGGSNGGSSSGGDSESESLALQMCQIQMQCESEASGVLPPEGKVYDRQMNMCVAMTKPMIGDRTRPQARKCVGDFPSTGCAEFERCVAGPEIPTDTEFWGEEGDPFATDEATADPTEESW